MAIKNYAIRNGLTYEQLRFEDQADWSAFCSVYATRSCALKIPYPVGP